MRAERLPAVAFDLALRDGPRLADEPTLQLPAMDLDAQRGSRQPETGGGFGQGEHLLRPKNHRGFPLSSQRDPVGMGNRRITAAPLADACIACRASNREAPLIGSPSGLLKKCCDCLIHLVSFVVCAENVHGIAYVVKGPA